METRRWKAFLRLTGETLVEQDEDILKEFKEFVNALKRVGINYSIIVNVEGGQTQLLGNEREIPSMSETSIHERRNLR